MAKKTAEIKTRISPKQRFEAYKTLALNTLRAVMSPRTRQFADLTSHEMVKRRVEAEHCAGLGIDFNHSDGTGAR